MSKPKYWRSIAELEQTPEFLAQASQEFPTDLPMDQVLAKAAEEDLAFSANRRDFLKVLGFGLSAAALAACAEGPVKKAIPYVNKPDDIIPGVANWYASTSPTGAPVLVRTREGRPIKLEGNPDSSFNRGGLSALDHALLLNLYEEDRYRTPMKGSNPSDWEAVDAEIAAKLNTIKAAGGAVRVVTGSVLSPTTRKIIQDFLAQYPGSAHLSYDAVSRYALVRAQELAFGKKALPAYHFDRAMTIVGFSCDFLGTWISPVEYAADYAVNRHPDKPMSRHLQFESLMTITGAKADLRFTLNPSQQGVALGHLYNKIASKVGRPTIPGLPAFELPGDALELAASDLYKNRGKALVVCGTNDLACQVVTAGINAMLGSYGSTIDLDNPSMLAQGDDEAMARFAQDLEAGNIAAVLFYGANPVYNSPFASQIRAGLSKAQLTVSFATREDETSALCQYVCPDHHFLESWGDAQQTGWQYSLVQPTIYPLFKTRQAQDTFLKWSGNQASYKDYVQSWWESALLPQVNGATWFETLRKGVLELPMAAATAPAFQEGALAEQVEALKKGFGQGEGAFDLIAFEKVSIRDGAHANNPWLQELPDPVSKVSWDNYVSVPYGYAHEQGIEDGDVLEVKAGGLTMYMPAYIQPGQARQTLGIALGYGRTAAGKVIKRGNGEVRGGKQIAGSNAFALSASQAGAAAYTVSGVTVSKTGEKYELAQIQTFNTLYDPAKGVAFGNDYDRTERIILETNTEAYTNGVYDEENKKREEVRKHLVSLWDSHYEDPETKRNIHWKMVIDLNKCTGCGACVVACQAENNIPVVGKKEISRHRDMYWMRIDRYYSGTEDNPDVIFQPMLCQHCDNAPCETVCPVLATVHSNEGLNQMVYPRCVGTRYCANNCPYKVRRFNWFNYWNDKTLYGDLYSHSEMGRLVLNPDVTVRFRGVMEKCSFCVQRLQDAKLRAKVNANSTFAKPEDGEVKTACQQSCPTGAIVFGDFNDPESEVSKLIRHERSYKALEDIKVLPNVQYMTLVRNRTEAEAASRARTQKGAETHAAADHHG